MKSRISNKVEIRQSGIDRKGMYAISPIKKGEIVYIKGGNIITKEELYSSTVINSYLPISDEYYLGAVTPEEEEDIKLYNNHSCDPNCGLHGEITFIAIRDIAPGEELTVDYAFIDNENYTFQCHCGSNNCRKIVTGYDWKIPELQKKYYPYFAQYLKDKIDFEGK
ncbi:MAG: SET domain-containing protein-lysine N-methyltransferase [Candidatus Gastranaerophilales bacterium]|nr:SET domain-containing protein-lysine N-methyltransferase [Candidatus Gastranaerophilales bacterium]